MVFPMATEAQNLSREMAHAYLTGTAPHPNNLNAPKIELCSTLTLSKGLPCVAFCQAGSSLGPLHLSRTLYKSTLFMQNKPNFQDVQMDVNSILTKDNERNDIFASRKTKPIQTQFKANSKPIQSQSNPIQSQFKPNFKA